MLFYHIESEDEKNGSCEGMSCRYKPETNEVLFIEYDTNPALPFLIKLNLADWESFKTFIDNQILIHGKKIH